VLALLVVAALASDSPSSFATYCPACVNARCTPGTNTVAYPHDCTKFCACESTGAVEMLCPPGTLWDDVYKICNWPDLANCDNSAFYPGCDGNDGGGGECTTPPPPPPPTFCPECVNAWCTPNMCNQADTVPHPDSCGKYCICGPDGSIEMSCPDGLWFSPTTGVCDWPEQAGCTGGPYDGC
jgi:hypothetical protein